MMTEDRFLERVRQDARQLRNEPDDVMASRIVARVRGRLATPAPDATQWLASWFRPLAASISALALAAGVTIGWIEWASLEMTPALESLSANSTVEISAGGDFYHVGD